MNQLKIGRSETNITLARKFLDIMFATLMDNWMFEDFTQDKLVKSWGNLSFEVKLNHRRTGMKQQNFTLIELLVVIAIIAILASMLFLNP